MHTSTYFEQTLFSDQSPVSGEYFARASEHIFESDLDRSYVEVRIHHPPDESPSDGKHYATSDESHFEAPPSPTETFEPSRLDDDVSVEIDASYNKRSKPVSRSRSSTHSSTCHPFAIDQHCGETPPDYCTKSRFLPKTVKSPEELEILAKETKQDLRIFLLRQRHSYSRVQTSQKLFNALLECCHVFPKFKEFMIGFGIKHSEQEIGPPPLRYRPLRGKANNDYYGFECAYIIRHVDFTHREGKYPWSLRQTAIYHRYKPQHRRGCSTWILVGASDRAEMRLDQYTRSIDKLTDANPFELHVIFIDTAIASWRPYLEDITKEIRLQADKALLTMVDDTGDFKLVDIEDQQELQQAEDRIIDILLCLDSTLDTISTLLEMYDHFRKQVADASEPSSVYGHDAVVFALLQKTKEVTYFRKNVESLSLKVQSTRSLLSTVLERHSTHALSIIQKESQQEGITMRQLAEKGQRDSSIIKVLSMITLFYLPTTIVSNFYSTQFVTQAKEGDTTRVIYSQNWWLLFAISIPLTILTIAVWYFWANWSKYSEFFELLRGKYSAQICRNVTNKRRMRATQYPLSEGII